MHKNIFKKWAGNNLSCQSIRYSRVRNKHSPTLINFLTFFQGLRPYSGLHRAYLSGISIRYKWAYAYSFCQIIQGLRLFKGVRLFQTLEYQNLPYTKCAGRNPTTVIWLPGGRLPLRASSFSNMEGHRLLTLLGKVWV